MSEVQEAPKGVQLREGTYVFQLTQKIKPRTENEPPFMKKLVISPSILTRDPKTKAARQLRYIPGHPSMWVDEQDKLEKKWASANAWVPEFIYGNLTLEFPRDKEKIEYLMLRDDFAGKEDRIANKEPLFELVNKEMEAASDLEFEAMAVKAANTALTAKLADMNEHAPYFDIDIKREEPLVRADYLRAAKSNPKVFLQTLESKAAKVAALVKLAIKNADIDTAHVPNQAHWSDTKSMIAVLDPKKNATQSLIDFALSKDGADFLKRLQTKYQK